MSGRVSFADLLKAGADKDKKRLEVKLAIPTSPTPATLKPIAPERDFTRVANSIARKAVPDGLFIGKSKQIYDYLYSITRGAIQPTRVVRITKAYLMRNADIGSERTLHKNLTHLKALGLLKIIEFEGQHQGNEYQIFLPEEILPNSLELPHSPHPPCPLSKVQGVPPVEGGVGGVSYLIENKAIYGNSKTSFKDNEENDDEPAARGAVETVIDEVSKKLVGRGLKSTDNEKLKELAELLKMELEIAAARTNSISNVPAFLTEHLRRRLSKKSEIQLSDESFRSKAVSKSLLVGKTVDSIQVDSETYRAEPLSKQARETVLKTIREYIEKGQREFVMSFQDTYTAQDWQWLSENLPDEMVESHASKTQKADENSKG